MSRSRRRKCLHCGELFTPDARNRRHQRYCAEPLCRRASKTASQRRWLSKPANRDYFRDPTHVERVRRWRVRHPGYGSGRAAIKAAPLQDDCIVQATESAKETTSLVESALQDLLVTQPFVLIGLIANLTGSTLQEDIASSGRRLQQLGRDILTTGATDERALTLPHPPTSNPTPVQLDRSTPGPS